MSSAAGDHDERLFETYHELSKQRRHDLAFAQRVVSLSANPLFHDVVSRTFKNYPGARLTALPPVEPRDGPSLDVAVGRRRSDRSLDPVRSLPTAELSRLLHLAAGVTGHLRMPREGIDQPVRTVPSGGALYPVEVYVVASRVEGVGPGVHHYAPDRHVLEQVRPGPAADVLVEATSDRGVFAATPVTFALTAVLARSAFKYGERAYRFALLEAGHTCQNLLLGAASAGLAAVPFGGFLDDDVHDLLDVDGVDEVALYLVAVGWPAPRPAPVPGPDEATRALADRLLESLEGRAQRARAGTSVVITQLPLPLGRS